MIEAKSLLCGMCTYRMECTRRLTETECSEYVYDRRLKKRDLLAWTDDKVNARFRRKE